MNKDGEFSCWSVHFSGGGYCPSSDKLKNKVINYKKTNHIWLKSKNNYIMSLIFYWVDFVLRSSNLSSNLADVIESKARAFKPKANNFSKYIYISAATPHQHTPTLRGKEFGMQEKLSILYNRISCLTVVRPWAIPMLQKSTIEY